MKKIKVMEKPDATLLSFVDVEDLDMLKVLAGVWDVEMQQGRLPPTKLQLLQPWTLWTVWLLACLHSSSFHTVYEWRVQGRKAVSEAP